MPTTPPDQATPTPIARRTCYVINLYTWIEDLNPSLDLAARVSELVAAMPEIDHFATTVSEELNPAAEPTRVYCDLVSPTRE